MSDDNEARFLAAVRHNHTGRNGGMNKKEIKEELIKRYPTFNAYISSLEKRRHLVRFWNERKEAEDDLKQYNDVKSFVSVAPVLHDVNERWYLSMKKKYLVTIHDGGKHVSLMHYEWDGQDPIRDMDDVIKRFQKTIYRSNGSWKPYGGEKQHDMLQNIICGSNVSSYNRMMFQIKDRTQLRSFSNKIAAYLKKSFITIDIHFDTKVICVTYLSKGVTSALRNMISENKNIVAMSDPPQKYWYRHRGTHVWSTNGPPDCVKEWYESWMNKYNVSDNRLFKTSKCIRIK